MSVFIEKLIISAAFSRAVGHDVHVGIGSEHGAIGAESRTRRDSRCKATVCGNYSIGRRRKAMEVDEEVIEMMQHKTGLDNEWEDWKRYSEAEAEECLRIPGPRTGLRGWGQKLVG